MAVAKKSDSQQPSRPMKRKLKQTLGKTSDELVPAKKRRKSAKKATVGNEDLDMELGLDTAIGRLDNQLLADLIAQKVKKTNPDFSIVELEERRIPVHAIRDTTEWQHDRSLQQMSSFLEHFSPGKTKLASAALRKGAPHTLMVTSAGLRAADITRALRVFENPNAVVAKLFAKHIKLSEAVEYVKKTRIGIGVGTPTRIMDLLTAGK